MRVLILEDNDLLRELLTRLLQKNGIETDAAATIQAANELLSEEPYDIAILDNNLPDGLGVEFLPAVKQKILHAVMLTSDGFSDAFITTAKANGADEIFTKPTDFNQLIAYVLSLKLPEYR